MLVARGRIELPTRGFSIGSVVSRMAHMPQAGYSKACHIPLQ